MGLINETGGTSSELMAIYQGGDNFLARMKEMSDRRQAAEAALKELNLGSAAKDALASAESLQRQASNALEKAKSDACKIIADANQQIKTALEKANSEVTRTIADAQVKADALVDEASQKAKALEAEASVAMTTAKAVAVEADSHKAKAVAISSTLESEKNAAKALSDAADEKHSIVDGIIKSLNEIVGQFMNEISAKSEAVRTEFAERQKATSDEINCLQNLAARFGEIAKRMTGI